MGFLHPMDYIEEKPMIHVNDEGRTSPLGQQSICPHHPHDKEARQRTEQQIETSQSHFCASDTPANRFTPPIAAGPAIPVTPLAMVNETQVDIGQDLPKKEKEANQPHPGKPIGDFADAPPPIPRRRVIPRRKNGEKAKAR